MDPKYENLLELPFEGYPAKDVRLPDMRSDGWYNMSDELASELSFGCRYPEYKNVFSWCYNTAYVDAWNKSTSYKSGDDKYADKNSKASALLTDYVLIITRVLGYYTPVVMENRVGYTESKTIYEYPAEYEDENESVINAHRKYVSSNTVEHIVKFDRWSAKAKVENEYQEFLTQDPIYKPFSPLLSQRNSMSVTINKYENLEKQIQKKKTDISRCRKAKIYDRLIAAILFPFFPGIPAYMTLGPVYILIRKCMDFSYTAEWFHTIYSKNIVLKLIELILKWLDCLAYLCADVFFDPANSLRTVWVVIGFIIFGLIAIVAVCLTSVPVLGLIEGGHNKQKEETTYRNEMKALKAEKDGLEKQYREDKAKVAAFTGTSEYQQLSQINQKLADAYKNLLIPMCENFKEKEPEKKK